MHLTTTSLGKTKASSLSSSSSSSSCGGAKHKEAKVVVKTPRLSTKNMIISVGWADMPYQGDYMIDFAEAGAVSSSLPSVSSSSSRKDTTPCCALAEAAAAAAAVPIVVSAKHQSLVVRPSLSNMIALQRPTSPIRTTTKKKKLAIGWSDLPCQGDYIMDFSWAVSSRKSKLSSSLLPSTTCRSAFIKQHVMTTTINNNHNANTLQLRPARMKTIKTFSWADMPCQGDFSGMDFETTTTENRRSVEKRMKKRVRFSTFVEVRTYEVVLGSHPLCAEGMALELGWKHYGTEQVAMKDHCEQQHQHRHMSEFHIPFEVRRDRLLELTGMTGAELIELEQSRWLEEQCRHCDVEGNGGNDYSLDFTISPCA